jgi:hypothetical protein
MAYGIEITGKNNSYQILSDTSYTEHYAVAAASTLAANTTLAITSTDLVFAKPQSTTIGQNRVVFKFLPVISASPTSIQFVKAVHYVKLSRTSTQVSGGSTTGTYGVQIKNNSGTIIYDSRAATTGMNIIAVKTALSCGGAKQPMATGDSPVLTGAGEPNPGTTLSTVIYAGDPTNIYMPCTTGFHNSPTSEISGFYYDYANDRILHHSFSASGSWLWKNFSDLPIGSLIT